MMTRKPGDMHDEVPKLTRLFSDKERILIKESQWKYGLWHIAAVFFVIIQEMEAAVSYEAPLPLGGMGK